MSFCRAELASVEVQSLVWTRTTIITKVAIFKMLVFVQDLNAKVMKVHIFKHNYSLNFNRKV